MKSDQEPYHKPLKPSLKWKAKAFRYNIYILISAILLLCLSLDEAISQQSGADNEILKYQTLARQKPDDSESHRDLGLAYARNGSFDKASDEFKKAIEIEYSKGYNKGVEDTIRKGGVKIYARYVILSIALGLLIAAVIVSILSWSELTDKYKILLKNARVRAFIRNISVSLNPELRKLAVEIAQSKEKLRDAISRETDSSLIEAASAVLPRLDELTRQASLLLELQQNLTNYVKDIEPIKLETSRMDCEEKLRRENDQEAKRALEYQLKQINNKRENYSKAQAKIRTCDAVLNGIVARIDATSLDLMSLPSVNIRKQEFFERISAELDDELNLTRDAAKAVMDETT